MNRTIALGLAVLAAVAVSCTTHRNTQKDQIKRKPEYGFSQTSLKKVVTAKEKAYAVYNASHINGPVIPGLYEGAVPQGMAYDGKKGFMYISNYMFNGKPSSISVLSMKTGNLIKVLWLYTPDGSPFTGHVGGLAVSTSHLWIASGKGVYRTNLSSLYSAESGSHLETSPLIPTAVKGSFASYSGGILWVGEFSRKNTSYTTPDSHHLTTPSGQVNHAWMAGYVLDKKTDCIHAKAVIDGKWYPHYIISIPDDVQGAAFFDNILILSLSYGRRNKSLLVSFTNPLQRSITNHVTIDGIPIALMILDSPEMIKKMTAPPMTEGITNYRGSLAVVFESGSDKYRRTALYPQDRIQILPENIFEK